MKTLRIFDRTHVILDEVMNYNGLKYTWTLNGMGKSDFDIGLEDVKCTEANAQFFNHLEIVDENNIPIWGGQIVDQTFDEPKLHIGCFGYLSLFQKRELRAKTYATQAYGSLLTAMINDTNTISSTGVSIGSIASGSLQTTRIVQNTDYLLDKIIEYNNDVNYDYEVDPTRKFNFYLRKGADKPQYVLEYGGQADNILSKPQLGKSSQDMANSAYAETGGLTSTAQDTASQGLYGLLEGVLSVNSGITQQSTLDNMAVGAVQRTAYPIISLSITAKDSTLCPFSDISVGDAVTVSLIPYFKFKALMRIIEMTHDESTGRRDIVFGQIIYRPLPPSKKLYKK